MVTASKKGVKNGDVYLAEYRVEACQKHAYSWIQVCDHPDPTFGNITSTTHTQNTCINCNTTFKAEPHSFDKATQKCKCGYIKGNSTIFFDANGGKGKMDRQFMAPDKPGKLNANAFTWENHTFKGWNTAKDGSGKSYADGAKVELKEDITLYAQWYANVTIVANSKQVRWTGKPVTVEGYRAWHAGKRIDDVTFKGVTASRTETEIGAYEVKVQGATVNKTTDKDGEYLVTGIESGVLLIGKAIPSLEKPKARSLTYNGKDQPLVEAGKTKDGRILYSLNHENWSKNIPTGKDAGDYVVWYRVEGDWRHENLPEKGLRVTIAKKKVTVIADPQVKRIGEKDPELTYKVDGLVEGDKLTGQLTRAKGEKLGAYRIQRGTLSAGYNYTIDFIENSLLITGWYGQPTARPTATAKPTVTAKPTATTKPTVTPKPAVTRKPIVKPDPSAKPHTTAKPTVKPTVTAKPTVTPEPTVTAKPTVTPEPTVTAKPTVTPEPTVTAKPTVTPKPTTVPAQSDYTTLAQLRSSESDDASLALSWMKVDGADGYDVFFAKGANADLELYKSVRASEIRLQFTGLSKGEICKANVRAWERTKGEKRYIGEASPTVYAIAGSSNKRYCDAESVSLKEKKVVLKNGGTYRIRASLKGVRDDRTILNVANNLRYFSSDASVATVSATGKIRARSAGSCTIYILANNGVRASLKVRVR